MSWYFLKLHILKFLKIRPTERGECKCKTIISMPTLPCRHSSSWNSSFTPECTWRVVFRRIELAKKSASDLASATRTCLLRKGIFSPHSIIQLNAINCYTIFTFSGTTRILLWHKLKVWNFELRFPTHPWIHYLTLGRKELIIATYSWYHKQQMINYI